ncbi:MAG: GAF domain-containing DNA-binding protein [Luteolibacter sp.]
MSGRADRRITQEDLWRQLALIAASHPAERAVGLVLPCLGNFHDVDRVWIVRYNEPLTHFWNTHEWTRGNVSEHLEDLQAASVDMIRWMQKPLIAGRIVPNPDTELLPRQARAYQAELRRQRIRSSINVPLHHEGRLRGIFGYDMVRRKMEWSAAAQSFLTEIAAYIAALLYSRHGDVPAPAAEPSPRVLHIRSGGVVFSVDRDDLVLIEADGDYTHLHFASRPRCTELRSLKSWESQLPEEEFLRISQRHLIRNSRIHRLDRSTAEGWKLHLQHWSEPLAVGRAYRHRVRQHLGF